MHDSKITRFNHGCVSLLLGVKLDLSKLHDMAGYNAERQLRDIESTFSWAEGHTEYTDTDDGGTAVSSIEFDLYVGELAQLEAALALTGLAPYVGLTILYSELCMESRRRGRHDRVQYAVVGGQ